MELFKDLKSIDEYIAKFPADIQILLEQMRSTIRKAAPDASEKISYQMPTFFLKGNLVHFAALKNHIGFYPTPSAIVKYEKELKEYISTKGAVQFPLGKPLPLKLVTKMVEFRVEENLKKAALKAKKK
jgi:uncharacterized protein YdhG (YjbR/CyaY superfamily)